MGLKKEGRTDGLVDGWSARAGITVAQLQACFLYHPSVCMDDMQRHYVKKSHNDLQKKHNRYLKIVQV